MLQYIKHIITPYVQSVRNLKGDESLPALVIMDNFKGQVTDSVKDLLEENNVHIAFVPPNTTDLLQPLNVSVNKPSYTRRLMTGMHQKFLNNLIIYMMIRWNWLICAYQ